MAKKPTPAPVDPVEPDAEPDTFAAIVAQLPQSTAWAVYSLEDARALPVVDVAHPVELGERSIQAFKAADGATLRIGFLNGELVACATLED